MIIRAQTLMCHKVTHKNLTDSSPLFRNSYQIMESKLDILLPKEYNQDMESKLSVERRIIIVKNRLEELRKERGIKQEELAAALEVSRQTIGHFLNRQLPFFRPSLSRSVPVSVSGALSISWRATEMIIRAQNHRA